MTDYMRAHEVAEPMLPGPSGPLAGVKIVDLTQALAGPFCTMLLADLGADVVKVEPPHGDMARMVPPFADDDTERSFGGYFASINRNKRGIVLDLKTDTGRRTLERMVEGADALVENFRAGVMDGLGLSYESLSDRNPRLVYAAVRGFGDPRTGESPYVDWPAFDVVAQAMGGVVSFTGTTDGETFRVGPSVGDLYPATVAALGITAAVLHARQSGQGQFVDVAMYDALTALSEAIVYRYSYNGTVTRPTGNSHPQLAPFDLYPTADGKCAIAAPSAKHWEILCELMGRPELVDDPRTVTNGHRMKNADFVRQVMTDWTSSRTTAEIIEVLGGKVPVGPVHDAADLYADPHLQARHMLVAVDHPGVDRPVVFPNSPIKCTATPTGVHRRAPRLGEHTHEVLAELELEEKQ
ncbi:MAG TPA: CoA transferase [Acidimicrobiales bacterium]|nr:CoA transferase [Acidimicrobiales bacterium]